MNTLNISLPYSYVSELVNLSWRDISFAVEQGFLTTDAAIEHAAVELGKDDKPLQSVIDLVCLRKYESIHPSLDQLVIAEGKQSNDEVQEKFLYLLLNWVYEHREMYSDPLEVVEHIYADFNYPVTVSYFVRYMPSEQPPLSSVELNRERLYGYWKDYLGKQAQLWRK